MEKIKRVGILFILLILQTFFLISQNTDKNQLLDLSLKELMTMQISTATKSAQNIEDIPASVVVITREDIEKMGYQSLADIIQNIPGFYMINDYYWLGSENFGVRGFFSPGVLNDFIILVNGVNLIGDSYSDYSLSKIDIPVEAIDRIEVVRGPLSVLYGSGAFFGAINIITNKTNKSLASLSIGSYKYSRLFFRILEKTKKFHVNLNGSIYGDDGISRPYSDFTNNEEFLKNVGLNSNTLNTNSLKYQKKSFYFTLKYNYFKINFSHNITRKGIYDGLPSYPPGTFFNNIYTSLNFSYERNISSKLGFKAKITNLTDTFYWEYELLKQNSYSTNYSNSRSREIELNLNYKPNEFIDLFSGFVFHNIYYFYKTYDYPVFHPKYENTEIYTDNDVNSEALFFQLNLKSIKNISIVTGFRIEKLFKYTININASNETEYSETISGIYDNDKVYFIPQLAIIYKPFKFHSIKLLYGKAIKQPSLVQNVAQIHGQYPTLKPAFIETYEINYIFSPSKKSFFNLSLYYNKIKDLIVKRNIFNSETNTWELRSTNQGRMETKGIEFGLKFLPINNLMINLNINYQKTKNLEPDFYDIIPGYSPELLGYFKASYNLKKITLSIISRYIGRMETLTNLNTDSESNIERLGESIEPYFTFDFNARINNILNKDWFINIHIYNIFDKEIRFPTTPGNSWAEKGTLDYGRFIYFSIGKKF